MISIFICEDNDYYKDMLYECIKKYIDFEELDVELTLSTGDPDKVIDCIKGHKLSGLYFLDIELGGGYNGVDIAKEIRQHDPRGFIVFITSHQRYMHLTFEYKIEALAYIKKGNDENAVRQEVCRCIQYAYNKHISRVNDDYYIIIKTQNGLVSCEYEDILFFQTDPTDSRRIIIHTRKRQYTFYNSLDNLFKTLPKDIFFKCHKSYILNMANIPKRDGSVIIPDNGKIIMQNGAECIVSIRNKGALLKRLAPVAVRTR